MICFQPLELTRKAQYEQYLMHCGERGCAYSFINLFLWGRQKAAFLNGHLVMISQFDRRCVYPFPIGNTDPKPVLDAIIHDAKVRGIPCCLNGMLKSDCETLERLYPGAFHFYPDRDNYDYVYAIDDLADLKGRKFQKKRNHIHRFEDSHPNCRTLPLNEETRASAFQMLQNWYQTRMLQDPHGDYHLEQLALRRAFAFQDQLSLEGLVVLEDDRVLAFCMGSRLSDDTYDIHFEKAREDVDGAYAYINREFARHLRSRYPELRWLNREDDMGIEGLRKAKLSYCPDHLIEKFWARLWEDEDEHQ